MKNDQRFQLRFGPYKTPRQRIGLVTCEVRGEVEIVGISDGLIPWPLGRPPGQRGRASLVVFDGLAKAVRREAKQAVCHWWGASATAVWKWRKALGVDLSNEGTSQLRSEHIGEFGDRIRSLAIAKARDPERCEKIAAARRGKKRPKHVVEAMRRTRNINRDESSLHDCW